MVAYTLILLLLLLLIYLLLLLLLLVFLIVVGFVCLCLEFIVMIVGRLIDRLIDFGEGMVDWVVDFGDKGRIWDSLDML